MKSHERSHFFTLLLGWFWCIHARGTAPNSPLPEKHGSISLNITQSNRLHWYNVTKTPDINKLLLMHIPTTCTPLVKPGKLEGLASSSRSIIRTGSAIRKSQVVKVFSCLGDVLMMTSGRLVAQGKSQDREMFRKIRETASVSCSWNLMYKIFPNVLRFRIPTILGCRNLSILLGECSCRADDLPCRLSQPPLSRKLSWALFANAA